MLHVQQNKKIHSVTTDWMQPEGETADNRT